MPREWVVWSGGQTGVDRAALDVALALGIPCGGWCPAGRTAEDGILPERYPLRETPSTDSAQRTEWNVRDSDATLILSPMPLSGGTLLARKCAESLARPCLVMDPFVAVPSTAREWLERLLGTRLNVAGPWESECPGIYKASIRLLHSLLVPDPESE